MRVVFRPFAVHLTLGGLDGDGETPLLQLVNRVGSADRDDWRDPEREELGQQSHETRMATPTSMRNGVHMNCPSPKLTPTGTHHTLIPSKSSNVTPSGSVIVNVSPMKLIPRRFPLSEMPSL